MISKSVILILVCANLVYAVREINNIQWTVSRYENTSVPGWYSRFSDIPAKVPGGIYSDLRAAYLIGDILYRFNDVDTRWVAQNIWIYEGKFNVTELPTEPIVNLVAHGVDTVATIYINGLLLINCNNMFVRYTVDVKKGLQIGENKIQVIFSSPLEASEVRSDQFFTAPDCVPQEYNGECHVNQLRKMQASFGWDWGPAFPSVGIWKPLVLEMYNSVVIRSVSTFTEKTGEHWQLKIKTYLETNANPKKRSWAGTIRADLIIEADQKISYVKEVDQKIDKNGNIEVDLNLTISENVVRPWWPNGYGDQPLYYLRINVNDGTESQIKTIRIGFRTIELVEESASKYLNNTIAGQGLTFYFKVNGHPMFMKGSNWIPSHVLPEHSADPEVVNGLLEGAVDAHMNMLRVWGGGLYESDYFYSKCDELGILIWQDLAFACSMYPTDPEFIKSVKIEVEQNVKRLQHHPSIAIWAGNNENEAALRGNWYDTNSQYERYKEQYVTLYVETIKPIINHLDPSRRYLVSSPTNGLKSEQDGYIADNPYDPHFGDTHYYNYFTDNWNMNSYPMTRFASEYGFQSIPSILTLKSATKEAVDFHMDSLFVKHRQHSPRGYVYIDSQMQYHLKFNQSTNNSFFEKYIFYTQITQAMAVKAETEFYRQSQATWYTMGALYWQLNDVWQAPSWSSIDYERRWKMLHYFAVNFFAPVLVSPRTLLTGDVEVYLINDRFVPIEDAQIIVTTYCWDSTLPLSTQTFHGSVGPLSAKKQDITLEMWKTLNKTDVFFKFTLKAEGVLSSPVNYVFPAEFKSIRGLREPSIEIRVTRASTDIKHFVYWVDIHVDTIVLFLWLETPPIRHSYFQENGLIITTPYYRNKYVSTVDVSEKELENMITIQYYYEK